MMNDRVKEIERQLWMFEGEFKDLPQSTPEERKEYRKQAKDAIMAYYRFERAAIQSKVEDDNGRPEEIEKHVFVYPGYGQKFFELLCEIFCCEWKYDGNKEEGTYEGVGCSRRTIVNWEPADYKENDAGVERVGICFKDDSREYWFGTPRAIKE